MMYSSFLLNYGRNFTIYSIPKHIPTCYIVDTSAGFLTITIINNSVN